MGFFTWFTNHITGCFIGVASILTCGTGFGAFVLTDVFSALVAAFLVWVLTMGSGTLFVSLVQKAAEGKAAVAGARQTSGIGAETALDIQHIAA